MTLTELNVADILRPHKLAKQDTEKSIIQYTNVIPSIPNTELPTIT